MAFLLHGLAMCAVQLVPEPELGDAQSDGYCAFERGHSVLICRGVEDEAKDGRIWPRSRYTARKGYVQTFFEIRRLLWGA